jgi:hypothetical protein
MDPITVIKAASPIVKAAIKSINKMISAATNLAKGDAGYYSTYIAIASDAVKGLHDEYLAILRQAATSDLNDSRKRKKLLSRINDYTDLEMLRPALMGAMSHLEEGRSGLSEHAERLLILPRTRKKREMALKKYDGLLNELTGFLGSLGGYTGGSAVGLKEVRKLEAKLKAKPFDLDAVRDMIEEVVMNVDKSEFFSLTRNCGRVIEALRISFR